MDNRKLLPFAVVGFIALITIVYLSSELFFTIRPGQRAVIFRKFSGGLDKENVILPGFNMKAPWN